MTRDRGAEPAELVFHDLSAARAGQPLPFLRNFFHARATRRDESFCFHDDCDPRIVKASRRALERSIAMASLLAVESPTRFTDADVLCESTGAPHNPSWRVFVPTTFTSGLALVQPPAFLADRAMDDVDSIVLVTGICLFSSRTAWGCLESGERFPLIDRRRPIRRRIDGLQVDDQLSFYEREAVARLSRSVVEVATTVAEAIDLRIVMDIPRVQYYCYLVDAFGQGLVSADVVSEWFGLVDERHRQVTHALTTAVSRHAAAGSRRLQPTPSRGLDAIEAALRDVPRTGRAPRLDELVATLCASDPVWSLVTLVWEPSALVDLVHMSYAVEQLRNARWSDDGHPLMVAVDNPAERTILKNAEAVADKLGSNRLAVAMAGVYPQERVLAPRETATNLYYDDPGTRFVDTDGGIHDADDLLARLYGDASRPRVAAVTSSAVELVTARC